MEWNLSEEEEKLKTTSFNEDRVVSYSFLVQRTSEADLARRCLELI
jgi:hypothetical protein